MEEIKALLAFCEGAHDVEFVRRVVETCLDFKKVTWKFSEYPSPFNQFFINTVQRYAAEDLSLDMSGKFFLPDYVLQKQDHLIFIFNTGGSGKVKEVKELLKDFLTAFENSVIFGYDTASVVKQVQYLFLYDADDIGTAKRFNKIKKDFAFIEEQTSWSFADWIFLEKNPFGAIAGDKAAYIWGTNENNGTLEDLLLPMCILENESLIDSSSKFVDSAFKWDTEHTNLERKFSQIGKRKKSIITCAGQGQYPGYSLSVILKNFDLIHKDTFQNDENVKAFVAFIKQFLGV